MKVDNKVSFLSAFLAFIGTVIIVMDSFTPIHRIIDQFPKWKNISIAIKDLDTFDTQLRDGKLYGIVEKEIPGFTELAYIVVCNRSDLRDEPIDAIVKNQPITIGGVPFKIVHVAFENNSQALPLTTDYIFHEWVKDYRAKYFLKIGLSLITIAFFFSLIIHIKRNNNELVKLKNGETISEFKKGYKQRRKKFK